MIYLDYAATAPMLSEAIMAMNECLGIDGKFGNPASIIHNYGNEAHCIVENARSIIAQSINANPREIIFTSGATESNNLAIKGVTQKYAKKGNHIITSSIEHKSVLDVCSYLSKNNLAEITYLPVNSFGEISIDDLKNAIQKNTVLISIMAINNELGTLSDIKAIGDIACENDIVFHVDAAQAYMKIPLDVQKMNINLLSISAHKCYGPKGIGALYVQNKPKIKIEAQIHGGGHQFGLRSGTLATHQIAGFAEAVLQRKYDYGCPDIFFDYMASRFTEKLDGVIINTAINNGYKGILSVCFSGINGEALLALLPDIALSMGSACNTQSVEPSHVLTNIGLTASQSHSTIRISFGYYTCYNDIKFVTDKIIEKVKLLTSFSLKMD